MTQVMGIRHFRSGVSAQAVVGADMQVVGIVGTAPDRNPAKIALNKAIQINTNDSDLRKALGTTGTVAQALEAISSGLKIGAAKCVVVIVEEGVDAAATIANIVGSEANKTGMWALLAAGGVLGITPRLIVIPGFTAQGVTGVTQIEVTNGGSGYYEDFAVTATGGTGSGFAGIARVLNGEVDYVEVTNPGNYSAAPTALVWTAGAPGAGAAGTITTGTAANQVMVNMPTILSRLKAKLIPDGPTSSYQTWLNWIETLPRSMDIIHPTAQDAVVEINGVLVNRPMSPYIVSAYIARDVGNRNVPSKSAANQSINGIVGVSPEIPLDITADGSLGMQYIENHGGIVVKGDVGVDTSLSDGGFTFWGTDTLSDDSQWLFANVVRMRDYIEIDNTKATRGIIGKNNITLQTVQAVFNTLDDRMSLHKANSDIIDYRLTFPVDQNPVSALRQGFITVGFKAEEPPVLRMIDILSDRYPEALAALANDISIRVNIQQTEQNA